MTDLIAKQTELELSFTNEALAKTATDLASAVREGQLDRIPVADRLVARLFSTVRNELEPIVTTRARGPGAALRNWLRAVPLDTLVVLTLRQVLQDCLSQGYNATIQRLGKKLGMAVVQEAMIQKAFEVNGEYVNRTWAYLKDAGTTSERHIRKTMQAVVRNVIGETDAMHMKDAEYIAIGKHCLQACLTVGLVEREYHNTAKGTHVYFTLAPEIRQFLSEGGLGYIRTAAPAMICKPAPWANSIEGGYLTPDLRIRFPLSGGSRGRPKTRKMRREGVAAAGPVLACATYLQSHGFSIHRSTLDVLVRVWESGGGVLGVPTRQFQGRPEFPFEPGWDKEKATPEELERFGLWKRDTARWHTASTHHRSTVAEVGGLLAASRKHGDAVLYFPTMVDFRGRYYYRGAPNPQGGDIAKGILHFADKRPLGRRGVYWLKVHIANCFGYDKVRFDKRAEWVDLRLEALRAGLAAPEDSDLYRAADSPFCAIAAVTELCNALDSGHPESYCTGLPVHMDATCSGLQHFSALLRDPVGARFTNLAGGNGEVKEDIYMHVARLALAKVQRHAADDTCKDQLLARLWLDIEISRALAKKPVMTYPYGATVRGVADHVAEYLHSIGWHVDGVSHGAMGMYMGRVLFSSVEDTVPAAAACMRWLRERVGDAPRDQPMAWHTPALMRVVQDYQEVSEHRVDIRSCGLSKIVVQEYLPTTKLTSMKNGVSPNFVHGLDAAHLTYVALGMQRAGLCMVGIHDSYGTHPGDVDAMHTIIREEFVRMYDSDILGSFLHDVGQEAVSPPPVGNLDLQQVLSSEFFFC